MVKAVKASKTQPVPVVVRVWKPRPSDPAIGQGGTAILCWPLEPATNRPGLFSSWERVGQHGAASIGIVGLTRPATDSEAAACIREWRAELAHDPQFSEEAYPFRILRHFPSYGRMLDAHRAELERIGA
jgi:hypothetical protein